MKCASDRSLSCKDVIEEKCQAAPRACSPSASASPRVPERAEHGA